MNTKDNQFCFVMLEPAPILRAFFIWFSSKYNIFWYRLLFTFTTDTVANLNEVTRQSWEWVWKQENDEVTIQNMIWQKKVQRPSSIQVTFQVKHCISTICNSALLVLFYPPKLLETHLLTICGTEIEK